MFYVTRLQALRRRHYALRDLPDQVRIPAAGGRPEIPAKPIEQATLDDLAFASAAIDAEFSAIADRLHAVRRLYALARKTGALGADIAVDAAYASAEDR